MQWSTSSRSAETPAENTRAGGDVVLRPGVRFLAFVERGADDPISQPLAEGFYPDSFRPLVGLLETLAPIRGGRVLDLGTHVGAFTLAAAALGYEVLGVEAGPRNAALLRASLAHNGFHNARLVQAAISDRPGTLEFCQAGPYGHVAPAGTEPGRVVRIASARGDDLLDEHGWDRVDFVKMDIEGSEVAGLRGLARLLGRPDAPPLVVESNGHTLALFGETPRTLKGTLEGFGYRLYEMNPPNLLPVRRGDLQPFTCVDLLAVKGALPLRDSGWRMVPPLSLAEVTWRAACSARSPNPADRGHIARELACASQNLLTQKAIREAVNLLRADGVESVRAAARAIRLPPRWLAWLWRRLPAWNASNPGERGVSAPC